MTYIFVQKNGSAVITLSASNLTEAKEELKEIVIEPEAFRFEESDSEEEEEEGE